MQNLIAAYLFQNKNCPLPGLGTLSIATTNAVANFVEATITPPMPIVAFDTKENDASNFVDYIATKTHSTPLQVIEKLSQYCNNLKSTLTLQHTATIEGVGNFITASDGNINFTPAALPNNFLQPIKATRVIHLNGKHTILVGDTETDNTAMAAYLADEAPVQKKRWWVWPIILTAIALLLLLIYFINNNSSYLGNAMPI